MLAYGHIDNWRAIHALWSLLELVDAYVVYPALDAAMAGLLSSASWVCSIPVMSLIDLAHHSAWLLLSDEVVAKNQSPVCKQSQVVVLNARAIVQGGPA